MRRLSSFAIIVSLSLASIIYGQGNFDACRNGETTIPDPKWRTVPPRFEIFTELISGNEMLELSQAFSPQRDAVVTNTNGGPIQFYWNFGTREQFEVLTLIVNQQAIPQCLRQVIDEKSQTSVIAKNTLYLKPSVLLGYGSRNELNSQWGNLFIGTTDLRGMPAYKFISCFNVPDIGATVSATYYTSDPTKFQAYLKPNESLILQIDVEIRNTNGRQEQYTYNVYRFTPNPSRREERQALETPSGVYCPDRISTLDIPSNIPERISSNSEVFLPQLNTSILSSHGLYDTEFRLTRFDIWYPDPFGGPQWLHYSEIHDFANGLNYQYNYTNRQCTATNLTVESNDASAVDGKPNVAQIGTPQHLFMLDDIKYQYTGEKQCRDHVICNVWIGEKLTGNNSFQHREWYWARRVHDVDVKESFPVKFIVKNYVNASLIYEFESMVFNYVHDTRVLFEIDSTLAECYRALGPAKKFNLAVLSFKLENDKKYPVLENLNTLRYNVFEALMFTLRVRPIRLSKLIVDKDGDDVLVTFTLLDAPPVTGPVESPLKEVSLDRAIQRLNSIIDSEGFLVRARYGTKEVLLRARASSLNTQHTSSVDKAKTAGPQITGLWIGFIIVGLVVGAISGFLVFAKLSK